MPIVEKFEPGKLSIYRNSYNGPDKYVSALMLGEFSPIKYASALVLQEFLKYMARKLLVDGSEKELLSQVKLVRVSNQMLILIQMFGTNVMKYEALGETYLLKSWELFQGYGENEFALLKRMARVRAEKDFVTVKDYAHEDAKDLVLSERIHHSVLENVLRLLSSELDYETMMGFLKERFVGSRTRVIVEYGHYLSSKATLSKDAVFGNLEVTVHLKHI